MAKLSLNTYEAAYLSEREFPLSVTGETGLQLLFEIDDLLLKSPAPRLRVLQL